MKRDAILSQVYPREEHDVSFQLFVQELLEAELLENDAVRGIGKRIAADGIESLTEKQLNTFVDYGLIKPSNVVGSCNRCAFEIPWSEMYSALEDGYCGYCRHIMDKDN